MGSVEFSVYENAKRILERVREAERRAGLPEGTVRLVAASKLHGAEAVREAFNAGVRIFGENRVQELEEKQRLGAYEGAKVHFIGHLQRNKVKTLVGLAEMIESVDSAELARRVAARARELGITQRILLEVNIGREEQKSGVLPEELPALLDCVEAEKGIFAEGLMAIPPATGDLRVTAGYFEQMRKLYVDIGAKKYDNSKMNVLSMGMSADFETAIACGANAVRVGTAIFGART